MMDTASGCLSAHEASGPLVGVRVLEFASVGPCPFAGMMLSDMGAEVISIHRTTWTRDRRPEDVVTNILDRGRKSVAVDLKSPKGREVILKLVESADALIEGFRPGVCERLGVGPSDCLERNPKLVYGRMTGWGQDGPYSQMAGHDINFVALSGTLSLLGRAGQPPTPPANLVGDFGGGGMYLAFGVVCAILEASCSGKGQVVDAAMVEGSASLAAMIWGYKADGLWGERGTNKFDTGAYFYDVFETADGLWVSFGSVKPKFHDELLRITGLAANADGRGPIPSQEDRDQWPAVKSRLRDLVLTKTKTNGADSWKALTSASHRCSNWTRHRNIPTSDTEEHSSKFRE